MESYVANSGRMSPFFPCNLPWHGEAWQGKAWRGLARQGEARQIIYIFYQKEVLIDNKSNFLRKVVIKN